MRLIERIVKRNLRRYLNEREYTGGRESTNVEDRRNEKIGRYEIIALNACREIQPLLKTLKREGKLDDFLNRYLRNDEFILPMETNDDFQKNRKIFDGQYVPKEMLRKLTTITIPRGNTRNDYRELCRLVGLQVPGWSETYNVPMDYPEGIAWWLAEAKGKIKQYMAIFWGNTGYNPRINYYPQGYDGARRELGLPSQPYSPSTTVTRDGTVIRRAR